MSLLGAMVLGTGTASATVAGMEFETFASEPVTVTPGANAGYSFTIHNNGSSNISQLVLSAPGAGAPVYISNDYGTTCQTSPSLSCAFGSLPAGGRIHVVVAYDTTGFASPFSVTFNLDSTGGPTSDAHHSHGDSVSKTLSTPLSSSPNFVGGFQLTGSQITTTGLLSRKNLQNSSVKPKTGATFVPVTIQDGLQGPPGGGTDPCTTSTTFNCIGDWTSVRVGSGGNVDGPIIVTLLLYGSSVPNGATVDTIGLWHEGSSPNPIMLRCSDPSSLKNHLGDVTAPECVTVTTVGKNFQIEAYLHHNGGLRGTF